MVEWWNDTRSKENYLGNISKVFRHWISMTGWYFQCNDAEGFPGTEEYPPLARMREY